MIAQVEPNPTHQDTDLTSTDRVIQFRKMMESGQMPTMVPALPLLLNLNGKPYTLEKHFPFESVFRVRLPRNLLLKTGRQVSKSTSLAARGLIISNAIPHFSTLFITPLYEQIRRFSTNYVRPFIDQSPVKSEWISTNTENSVLQRSFKNYSRMYFSFALTDADRVRGIPADANNFDEIQDMDRGLIPIIKETMSASDWRLCMYTGTPKTLDNTMEGLWKDTSQAEWEIPCLACGKWNIPSTAEDLEKMIGPWREDISIHKPATICANPKCGKVIDPKAGRWIHQKEEKRWTFPGYHIPQVIMPMHYKDPVRWSELLAKREGYGNVTLPQFYNEVLGESYDTGSKLVTETDLKGASILPWRNQPLDPREIVAKKSQYSLRIMGVDWGGGGENEISFTVMAVVGMRPDGKLDVLYGRKLLTPHQHVEEAKEVLKIFRLFDCHYLAHDYNGAGNLRETFMVQSGLPFGRVAPLVYYRSAARDIMTLHRIEEKHHRDYWHLDKARSLQLICQCIKFKHLRFFKYDYVNEHNRGLIGDFLALQENKIETARGGEIYTIQRNPHLSDDFAHAVNFACCVMWHRNQNWPNLAKIAAPLTMQQQLAVDPGPTDAFLDHP